MITEIGGTVGDIESLPFLEAIRQLYAELGAKRCMFLHLTLVPYIGHAGELKTKPTQHSVNELRRIGIQPHALLCRSEQGLDREIRKKIALFASVPEEAVISARDVDNIYKVPLVYRAEGVDDLVLDHFAIEAPPPDLDEWEELMRRADACEGTTRIALVGKYVQLADAYKSVIEALTHGGYHHGTNVEVELVDSEDFDPEEIADWADGILIPGGFGERGIEGKIEAAQVARERGIPYLGICLGMQIAVAEFARHVAGMDGANSTEFDPETPYPGRRPAARAEGGLRHGRDDAPRRRPGEAPRGDPGAGDLRRGRDLQAPPPSLRGQQPASPPARGRGPGLRRHLARRAPGRDRRAARPPVLRRLAVPPRVQLAPDPARAAVPRVRRRRGASSPRERGDGPATEETEVEETAAAEDVTCAHDDPSG